MNHFNNTLCAVVIGMLSMAAGPAAAQTQWFSAQLSGANEVGEPGDSDGWGIGVIGVGPDTVSYYIWVTDIAEPTAGHIHSGSAGQNGGIAVDFEAAFSDAGGDSWVASGSVSATAGTISSILENPSAFYFNVHNSDHSSGAVRGQVLGDGASPFALAGTLNGSRQVDNPGDPDGEGFASVVFDDGTAHFYFNVMNTAAPSAAHIHRGTASSVEVDDDLALEILASPHQFYFNVHTSEFSSGAVRGQLRATETVRIFPVISRISGLAGSEWRTALNVMNLNDADITAWARWFPANDGGLDSAEGSTSIDIAAGSTEVIEDAVNDLFGAYRRNFRSLRAFAQSIRYSANGGSPLRLEPRSVFRDRFSFESRALQPQPVPGRYHVDRQARGWQRPWQRFGGPRAFHQCGKGHLQVHPVGSLQPAHSGLLYRELCLERSGGRRHDAAVFRAAQHQWGRKRQQPSQRDYHFPQRQPDDFRGRLGEFRRRRRGSGWRHNDLSVGFR
jgi:hypothetical protein